VYLANALVPANPRVTISGQQRDTDQRDLVIDFTMRDNGRAARTALWLAAAAVLGAAIVMSTRGRPRSRKRSD
jgi:hypothetical protein